MHDSPVNHICLSIPSVGGGVEDLSLVTSRGVAFSQASCQDDRPVLYCCGAVEGPGVGQIRTPAGWMPSRDHLGVLAG